MKTESVTAEADVTVYICPTFVHRDRDRSGFSVDLQIICGTVWPVIANPSQLLTKPVGIT